MIITLYRTSYTFCDIINGFTGACDAVQVDVLAGLLVVGHKQGEARVYQFSQEQQEVSCVDLDGKRPAEHHSRQQPPGFQCILQCTHHAASISGIAIAARLKLVGLADETGVLSLLELTRVQDWTVQQKQVARNTCAALNAPITCVLGLMCVDAFGGCCALWAWQLCVIMGALGSHHMTTHPLLQSCKKMLRCGLPRGAACCN